MNDVPHVYFTVSQSARALGMLERTVKTWVQSGQLPSIQPNGRSGRRYVLASDLLEFAASRDIVCHLEHAV